MQVNVRVMSSASVVGKCEMHGTVHDSDYTSFVFGRVAEPLDIAFDVESLRRFIGVANDSLREMEQRQAEELAGAPERTERKRFTPREDGEQ